MGDCRNHLRLGRYPNPEHNRKRRTHSLCPSILRALQKEETDQPNLKNLKNAETKADSVLMPSFPVSTEGSSRRRPFTEGSFSVPTIGSILKSNRGSVRKIEVEEKSNRISLFKDEEKEDPIAENEGPDENLPSEPSSIDISEQEVISSNNFLLISSISSQLEQALGISSLIQDINRGTQERPKFRLSWV
jgi:hypothetical protein